MSMNRQHGMEMIRGFNLNEWKSKEPPETNTSVQTAEDIQIKNLEKFGLHFQYIIKEGPEDSPKLSNIICKETDGTFLCESITNMTIHNDNIMIT